MTSLPTPAVLRPRSLMARLAILGLLVASLGWVPPVAQAAAPASFPGQFVSLSPARILDTRFGVGGTGPVNAGTTVRLQVAGRGGVPATGIGAVVLNVTVTDTGAGGYVTVYPSDDALPTASNLNFAPGETIPNLVVAKLGSDGMVNLTAVLGRPASVQLIADVAGYVVGGTPSAAGAMVPLAPSRVLDTRTGNGATGPVSSGATVKLPVAGRGGVPASGAGAVVLNVTVTDATAGGYATAYPSGTALPLASNLNFSAGQTIPNLVMVPLGGDGAVNFYVSTGTPGSVSLIADVMGYVVAGQTSAVGAFSMQAPARILDTRYGVGGFGPVLSGATLSLQVGGRKGVPATGVGAAVLNVTAVDPTGDGYVTVHPSGTKLPLASNLNLKYGRTIPNLVIAKLGADGKVNLSAVFGRASDRLSLVVDVVGYLRTDAPELAPSEWASFPELVPADSAPAVGIAAGGNGSLTVRADGTVTGWGSSGVGAAVPGSLQNIRTASYSGYHGLALTNGGVPIAWGGLNLSGENTIPASLSSATAVSSGGAYNLALTPAGTVTAWGGNTWGETDVPAGLTGVTAISAGPTHALALKSNGTVVAWGSNIRGEASVPASATGVIAIATGGNASLALKSNGTVIAWGDNQFGQSTVPAGLTGITAIAAGGGHSLALRSDGRVVAWGRNNAQQTAVPTGLIGATAIAAGLDHSIALTADGTVVAWGSNSAGQSAVPRSTRGLTSLGCGAHHTVALRTDGTVAVWGQSDYGQLSMPLGLAGVTAVAAGGNHSVALKGDGTVVVWGTSYYGGPIDAPAGLSGVTAVAAGAYDSLALKSDGTVVSWGGIWAAVPAGLSGVTAIASGNGHSLALKSDGTVVAWGGNDTQQSTVPGSLSGVTAIAAGLNYSVAVKSDQTIVTWGASMTTPNTSPAGLTGVTAVCAGDWHAVALARVA